MSVTLSVDHAHCPACELAPLVKVTATQRQCNTCGFQAVLVTEEDEREAEQAKGRKGKEQSISRFQTTW